MSLTKKASWGKALALAFSTAASLIPILSHAQFSNDWIDFSRTYYKIPVASTGIYRILYSDLQNAGVPVGSIDPRRINLFHRGVEQAIFIQGEADARLDPTDYIEFFGRRNDGSLDADLYNPQDLQPHTYYNLFNDTTSYFLTWNPLPVLGKRMTSFSEPRSGLNLQTYHNAERLEVYSSDYATGLTVSGEIQSTAFDRGEGWTGSLLCKGLSGCTGQQDLVIDKLTGGVPAAGQPQLDVLLIGRDEVSHQVEIYSGTSGRLLSSVSFGNFDKFLVQVPFEWGDIGTDGKMIVRVRLVSGGNRDQLSVSFVKVTFPQVTIANLQSQNFFSLPPSDPDKLYVEFQNTPAATRIWDITEPDNTGMIGSVAVPGGIGAALPSSTTGRKLYLSNITSTTALRRAGFRALVPSQAGYVLISHRSLMKPAGGYGDVIQAYAAYRASAAGGGYDTLTVSMDQLYDQFNYGETSPRAIFQFMKFLVTKGHPKFLFLIGKGLEVSQGYYRKASHAPADFRDLVPSAGMPGSDMAFTSGLKGSTFEPAVPTGRLTASTPAQVADYLSKVKESEALAFDNLWRKDLLHLSGGIAAGEPELFRSYMDGFKAIAENYYLGGSTETISKQTLNVELINVKDQVNKGLNLITFYGHSGPGTIDIDIGNVSDPALGYNNKGKYPGFLINGCNAGRFFDNRVTFGEDWMLTPAKGAKAFIAHSYFGFSNGLKQYTDIFYSVAFGDSTFLHKGIGEVQQETARRYLAEWGTDLPSVTQVQQMVLLGDPAVQLFGAKKPDYAVNNESISIVSLDGKPVTVQSNAFAIDMSVRNFGRAQPGQVKVRVVRTLEDNSLIVYDSLFEPILYSGVWRFVIRKKSSGNGYGSNGFTVIIDPDKTIPELNEGNNTASIDYYVARSGTKNLFPQPYAIVNTGTIDLTLQNTDLLAQSRGFRVEADTSETFDSPFLKRQVVSGKVIAKMPLTLLADDSVVYYWRTRFDKPVSGESIDWTTSSFTYIHNVPEGWAQIRFPQLMENLADGLLLDPSTRRISFPQTVSSVDVNTFGSASATPFSDVSFKINDEEFNIATQEQHCRNNSLNLVAFDKGSSAPYPGIPFTSFFDPRACGRAPQVINSFLVSELETASGNDLSQWVTNVSASDSVVIFSIGDVGYASWSAGVMQSLLVLGVAANQLSGMQAGEPFVIFGKKGAAAGSAKIFRPSQAPANAQAVAVNGTITGRGSEGSLSSVLVGPAQQWSQLNLQLSSVGTHDQYGVDVLGINLIGQETRLKSKLTSAASLADVDAGLYPYLRLILNTKDEVDQTPVQLRKWLVTYTPVTEGMITYGGNTQTETVQEGQAWETTYGFVNLLPRSFADSLFVQIDILSTGQQILERKTFRIAAPAPHDTTHFSFPVTTKGKAGANDITVFVNPRVQPEQYFDNNFLTLTNRLQVVADRTPPVLDVTVDGRHLINGDLVSAAPEILAKVVDENKFIPKTDTTGVNMYLLYPCAQGNCVFQRIAFSSSSVIWTPATASAPFQVSYRPAGLTNGSYTLKVDATDGSGNASGTAPYEISFSVTDANTFVLVSVYPNPSSDKFYFKVFLSGLHSPDDMQLELYSAMGGLIRSFGHEEFGSVHVGTNEIVLGATDSSGNPLPAGIYFFRMSAVLNGDETTFTGKLVVR